MQGGNRKGKLQKGIDFKEKQNLPFYLANDHILIHTVIIKALNFI